MNMGRGLCQQAKVTHKKNPKHSFRFKPPVVFLAQHSIPSQHSRKVHRTKLEPAENTSNSLRFDASSCLLVVAVHEVVLGSLAQETFLMPADGTSADHLLDLVAVTKGVGGKHGGDNRRMFDTGG